jgi:hypothetical protein
MKELIFRVPEQAKNISINETSINCSIKRSREKGNKPINLKLFMKN